MLFAGRFPRMARNLPPRVASLPLVLLIALVSCLQGAKAPNVPATRTLTAPGDPAARPSDKEFGAVFSAPHGETVDLRDVTIVWNRPMRPLDLEGQESAPPAS